MGILTMRATTSAFLQRLLSAEFPGIDAGRVTRMAINFVLSTAEVDCVLVGMRSVEEVAANAALADDEGARLDLRALHDRYA
jgi:aryl-alcohol dehydrogenase-like predicted oxidoreductase